MDRQGNLDNRPVPRVLVHIDVFSKAPEPQKTTQRAQKGVLGAIERLAGHLFTPARQKPAEREIDPLVLSGLWRWADQRAVVLEAFDTGATDIEARAFLDKLEEHQQHPFRTAHGYKSANHLAAELPMRRDLVGVCDVPERGMHYGSWWVDPRVIY